MNQKRRTPILYITPAGERGGAEVVLLNLLKRLNRTRFTPVVVCLQEGSFVDEMREQAQVEVEVIASGRFRNPLDAWRLIRKLQTFIRNRKIQLVHSTGTGAHLYGGIAAKLCGIPSIFHVHDMLKWFWSRQGVINRLALLVPTTVAIAVSRQNAECLSKGWVRRTNVRVIYNALAPESFVIPTGFEKVVDEFGWDSKTPLIVWCGRLQRWKGTHVFLEAAAEVRKQIPDVRFLVVGGTLFGLDSDYEKELHTLAIELNLNNSLQFTGHRNDARRLMAAADMIVHSSILPDSFNTVVLEAMAIGKPVIATNDGGHTEIIESGKTGLLVEPGNHHLLANAIIQLIQNESERIQMGNAARTRIESLSISNMMQQLEGVYDSLLTHSLKLVNQASSIVEG